jgi:hypothetical protein
MFGIVMCYALLLSRDLRGRQRLFCRVGSGIGLFLSLSSAPWLAFILGCTLVVYRRVARFPRPWLVLVSFGGVTGTIFFFVHPHPLGWMFNHLALDASTGYYRLLIWQYAGADIMQSPWFGIGMTEDWARPLWMPKTIDSLWLRSAMTFGIPGSILIAVALVGASSLRVQQTLANAAVIGQREIVLAETLGIITFLTLFLGFTVHYWGACWFLVGALAGLRGYLGQVAAK